MVEHSNFMREALIEANKAKSFDEVPIGAVIVLNEKIIGRGFNSVIGQSDPSGHAEIIALRNAGRSLNNYRIPKASIYVTLEPCVMCLGAIFQARLEHVYFGAYDPKFQSCHSNHMLINNKIINHQTQATGGLLENQCGALLKSYFKNKR